ncbi:MAG: DUF4190 domain-containing protein [Anaerolineales bacterium]|jgi:hypothetical protein
MSYETPSGGAAYAPPNSSMAIISLIAGVLGLTFFPVIGSIVALITGYMAKREIQESAGDLGGDGMATAGIILGWIGVALGILGICIAGVVLAIPLCLIPWGVNTNFWLAPMLLSVLA